MRFGLLFLCTSVPVVLACSGGSTSGGNSGGPGTGSSSGGGWIGGSGSNGGNGGNGGSDAGPGTAACSSNGPLAGASYDVGKSRFAFGSKPTEQQTAGGLTRWVGSDGAVAIFSDGSEMGSLNANAPESSLPGWSGDDSALFAHVTAYYETMGVQSCQIAGPSFTYGAGGSSGSASGSGGSSTGNFTIAGMTRAIEGVAVDASLASAQFDANDQTVYEAFYWPEIPAEVVSAAVALHAKLSDPAQLAAYKAKLPADAQGDGKVIIHHSHAGSQPPFQSIAVYTVIQTTPQNDGGALYFDANANPVTLTW
jgi:hypothetical protein